MTCHDLMLDAVVVFSAAQALWSNVTILWRYQFFPSFNKRCVAFRTVKRIFYKDGERIKLDSGGVDLLQTFLVLDIQKHYSGLRAKIEYLPLIQGNENNNQYKLKLTCYFLAFEAVWKPKSVDFPWPAAIKIKHFH